MLTTHDHAPLHRTQAGHCVTGCLLIDNPVLRQLEEWATQPWVRAWPLLVQRMPHLLARVGSYLEALQDLPPDAQLVRVFMVYVLFFSAIDALRIPLCRPRQHRLLMCCCQTQEA